MGRLRFDVGGVVFAMDQSFLQTGPDSKLKRMFANADLTSQVTPFILNRPPELFAAIVSFYVTGDLHIPMTSCPGALVKELEFWEIDESYITTCCLFRLDEFKDRQRKLALFQQHMTRDDSDGFQLMSCGSLAKQRAWLWSFLEKKGRGTFRELYFVLLFLMILVSLLTVSLGTMEENKRNLTNCERLDFMKAAKMKQYMLFAEYVNKTNCDNTTLPDFSPNQIRHQDTLYGQDKEYVIVDLPRPSDNKLVEIEIPILTVPNYVVVGFDIFTLVFFTIDFILRVISCPNLVEYFKSLVNLIDAAALLLSYTYYILLHIFVAYTQASPLMTNATFMFILRTLRLSRIARGVREGRALAFTFHQIIKELWVVFLILISAICIFACLVYSSESKEPYMFENIPAGIYWAVITLTTVGYGDIRPVTGIGKLIACICAVFGIILFALTIPIFINQLILFNRYASLKIRSRKMETCPNTYARNDATERLIGPDSSTVCTEVRSQGQVVETSAI